MLAKSRHYCVSAYKVKNVLDAMKIVKEDTKAIKGCDLIRYSIAASPDTSVPKIILVRNPCVTIS